MRGRRGGFIGEQPLATSGSLPGIWRASEILTLQRLSAWPNNYIQVSIPQSLDVTETGSGGISATVSSSYNSPTYLWQKSIDDGATWTTVSGATVGSLNLTGQTASNDEDLYRVVVSKGIRSTTSNWLQVRRETSVSFSFFSQPQSQTVPDGQTASFMAIAGAVGAKYSGTYSPTYQWQVSSNGGATWANVSGATDYYLQFFVAPTDNGKRYRARVTSLGVTGYSDAAVLTVDAIQVSVSPEVGDHTVDGSVQFTASVTTSLPSWSLEWQYKVSVQSPVWLPISQFGNGVRSASRSGANYTQLTLSGLAKTDNGLRFRAVVTSSGFTGESAVFRTEWEALTISWIDVQSNPGQSLYIGETAQLSATAVATGNTTGSNYQMGQGDSFSWEYLNFANSPPDWRPMVQGFGTVSASGNSAALAISYSAANAFSYSGRESISVRLRANIAGSSSSWIYPGGNITVMQTTRP